MFTKVKRFMAFVVVLFACFMFVACKGNTPTPQPTPGGDTPVEEPKLDAPTSIDIVVDFAPLDNDKEIKATSIGGDDIVLVAEVPDGCDDSVIWYSEDESIATVDENGFVTPVKEGLVTIVATSAVAPSVSAEVKIRVHPANVGELLLEALDYVKKNVKYLDGNGQTRLPADFRKDILSYQYYDVTTGQPFVNNVYTATNEWRRAQDDSKDMMKVVVTYKVTGVSMDTMFDIYVVKDVESNDFTQVAAARAAIEALFANENMELYEVDEKSLAVTKDSAIAVQWASSNEKVLKVVQTAGTDTTDNKKDDVFKVEYSRPIDNTTVELSATILSAGPYGETVKFNITARGYSKVEKVAYFRDTICAKVPAADARVSKDILLPTFDGMFGMQITWASDHPEIMSAAGVYKDDETKSSTEGTKVTLTATLLYMTASELYDGETEPFSDPNSFKETVTFEIMVYPCTDSARAANRVAAYTKEHLAGGTGWFPWGKMDREGNQLTGLPATMGDAGIDNEWKDVALNWTCDEEGLFDSDMNLLKQYLRYHRVMLTAEVKLGDNTEVIEVPLNVGLAQKEKTSHIGGSFSRLAPQANDSVMLTMDSLQTLSAFDDLVGSRGLWYKGRNGTDGSSPEYYEIIMGANEDLTKNIIVQPGADDDPSYVDKNGNNKVTMDMQFGIGVNCGFAGITMYWDDPETGIRFQFYACEAMTWVIGPDNVDENGELVVRDAQGNVLDADADDGKLYSMLDRYHENWEHIVLVNMSGKDVKIPVSYEKSSDPLSAPTKQVTYVPYDKKIYGQTSKYGGESIGETSITFFAGKGISIINNGVVGCIDSEKKWDPYLSNLSNGIATDTGVEYCQYLTLPDGAIGWSANSGQDSKYEEKSGSVTHDAKNNVVKMLSTAGNQITVEFWDIHPCNTFTTNDEWKDTEKNVGQLSSVVRVRDDLTTNEKFWARTFAAREEQPEAPKANVDLLSDLPKEKTGYHSNNWSYDRLGDNGWQAESSEQMRARLVSDTLWTTNMFTTLTAPMRYKYATGETLGLANKLSMKYANNFSSGSYELKLKVYLVDDKDQPVYILGTADEGVSIAANTDITPLDLSFDPVVVKSVVFELNGTNSGSQYFYVGDLHLTYYEPEYIVLDGTTKIELNEGISIYDSTSQFTKADIDDDYVIAIDANGKVFYASHFGGAGYGGPTDGFYHDGNYQFAAGQVCGIFDVDAQYAAWPAKATVDGQEVNAWTLYTVVCPEGCHIIAGSQAAMSDFVKALTGAETFTETDNTLFEATLADGDLNAVVVTLDLND